MEPFLVDVIRSCSAPISEAKVGWYPTADGIRPKSAETSLPAWAKRKILSIKSNTSCPSSSRKYSAMVKPVKPTRRRAPGGSFICPKTSAVLLITPDSFICRQRSFPSRDRSPTPAKTETPPCTSATLRISSCIMTVFPTPAPPKIATFPPLTNGAIRSMTLMPVSNTSRLPACSVRSGALRWIGYVLVVVIGPNESIVSPMTLTSRPSVFFPAGTRIKSPVEMTLSPRFSPSVGPMATARTRPSPK